MQHYSEYKNAAFSPHPRCEIATTPRSYKLRRALLLGGGSCKAKKKMKKRSKADALGLGFTGADFDMYSVPSFQTLHRKLVLLSLLPKGSGTSARAYRSNADQHVASHQTFFFPMSNCLWTTASWLHLIAPKLRFRLLSCPMRAGQCPLRDHPSAITADNDNAESWRPCTRPSALHSWSR